jgi:Family of unknown function (DUF6370)
MRKLIPTLVVAFAVASMSLVAFAAEVKTIVGEALCGKCALSETAKCQNVISVKEDGKTVKYYLENNKASMDFHKAGGICQAKKDKPVKVEAKGDVQEKDGKLVMTATEIKKAD